MHACARDAYAFLADGRSLGRWALGCFETKLAGDGLFVGHSLFDGKPLFVRIEGDPSALVVIYHVGSTADRLSPRIRATVLPRGHAGTQDQECVVSLVARREPDMTQERWRHVTVIHETEILLIKALIERDR
ncbi:MAG: hypothetical protein ACHQAY_13395 [Hyphomicrobiales bacterium]